MNVDLAAALRRRKPDKRLRQIKPRQHDALLAAAEAPVGPLPLVPDTNVYIGNAAGTLPPHVEALLDRALLFHCSVCLAELATGIAQLSPARADWLAVRDHYAELMAAIPATRVLAPDAHVWIDAALLSGILARTQDFGPYQRMEALNDALILLTAARAGLPVLTANRTDFALLQQLAPEVRFYHF